MVVITFMNMTCVLWWLLFILFVWHPMSLGECQYVLSNILQILEH